MIEAFGSRVIVEDIEPVDEITARAKRAGIIPVVYDSNKPRSTTGTVISIGPDPLIRELVSVGDTVFFNKLAGQFIQDEGKQYRSLEPHEVISVKRRSHSSAPSTSDTPCSQTQG